MPAHQMPKSAATNPQSLVDRAVQTVLAEFASLKLAADELAVTLVDLRDPEHPARGHYRGDAQIYPASVIKLFFLAAAHRQMEDGRLADTPELRRALSDMIVHSYNEATSYIVDLLTDTTSGAELPEAELRAWQDKRNAVNRYFASFGYTDINANRKTWGEGPYGREIQAMRAFKPERNFLTTNATARLLTEIATGKSVTAARSEQMMALLKRDFMADANHQARDYTARALPAASRLWSKAGWMSVARHDAAYIELPAGERLVLVIFTVDHANDREIIPAIARSVVEDVTNSS